MKTEPLTDGLRDRFKATAIEAAQLAGRILIEQARIGVRVEYKDAVNLVTEADRRAEQAIIEVIEKVYPEHDMLAEERGLTSVGESVYRWVIDPLDGTTNFAHGYPAYCVSIALEFQGHPILGVVFDPTRQELFVAEAGFGATLNGTVLRASRTSTLNAALLVTGFAYDIRESAQNNLNNFERFALRAQGLRRTGSAALDLCYVAAGRFDGFWEMKLHPWDMAAGALMVVEAGGRMSDFNGGPFSIYGPEMVASNDLIHDDMLEVLRKS
ncbi:MAG TPA: inositol monophosphatase family protein [Nitrospiraceae bacterium]|nr:inositol monophosphatase family protein [Nitrospiraceae bacterium]